MDIKLYYNWTGGESMEQTDATIMKGLPLKCITTEPPDLSFVHGRIVMRQPCQKANMLCPKQAPHSFDVPAKALFEMP